MTRFTLAGLLVSLVASGCDRRDAPKPKEWPAPLGAGAAVTELRRGCARAGDEQRKLLVEFSAPWCKQCRALNERLEASDVSKALGEFEFLVLNVGGGHELDDLRRSLDARAIPSWTVLETRACDRPPAEWVRVARTYPTKEPRPLAEWLRGAAD